MNYRSKVILSLALVAATAVFAQDEQSTASSRSASARYWTSPRIQPFSGETAQAEQKQSESPKKADNKTLTIENETLGVTWKAGRVTLESKSNRKNFAEGGFNAEGGTAKVVPVTDKTFGSGKAIEITYPNGDRDMVMLFPKVPFVLIRASLHTAGQHSVTRIVRPFQAAVNLGKPASALKTLGTGGLMSADENPGSYDWLAVADPDTRNGVVFGWLTHDRGDGVLFSKTDANTIRVGAQIDYGRLRLAPGTTEDLETLAVGYFDDARIGLETWADEIAKVYSIHLPPQPTVYCTWYSQPYGGSSDEKHLAENAEFAAKNFKPFGFSVIQIDDHWQDGIKADGPKRNFLQHDPKGPYPGGMKAAAEHVKSLGLTPGLWFLPFAGTVGDPLFADHEDWFVVHEDGKPYTVRWGGTCLDMTYEPARQHLHDVVTRITREWGFKYIKIDGLWTGTATPIEYVNSGYKDDGIGDAVFHDPDKSNIEAYRDGLKLVREAAGKEVFILGCNGPQNMRAYGGAFGLVDGMRVGPDNKADWKNLQRGPIFSSRHYFLNGRVWYNDPDPLYVRDSIPLNHAQVICSWVAISGDLNTSSEWYPGLSPERVDLLKRTMPAHGLLARPVDYFENDLPSLWLVTDDRHSTRRDVIGIFNWESKEQKFDYPLGKLGLDAKKEYLAFDYWKNDLVAPMKGNLQITVPAESCAVLAVKPVTNHPQLISTSRHITQGMVDVLEEQWDAKTKTLSGRSKVVAGDPYELRIVTPGKGEAWQVTQFTSNDKASEPNFKQSSELIRATLQAPHSGEVTWAVKFK